ncbi:LuxR C-terminal-related transcriptional regulator [Gordonia sp. DT219]|uniref:LuxR C-terminal-related transcriptional regulator n=1 Tax=Gordonia sp. DT219 TaxID=3416658 RepID=UPI003CF36AEF
MPESLAAPVTDALRRLRKSSGVTLAFGGVVQYGRGLRLTQFVGHTVGALDGVAVDVGHGLGGKVVAMNRPMVVDDYLATPQITHRYNAVIATEGLRAMAAAPVIVDGVPVAVIYGALHSDDRLGDRALDALAGEARTLEQQIVATRASVEAVAVQPGAEALRIRLTEAYARLRGLADSVDDAEVAAAIGKITDGLLDADPRPDRAPVALTRREQDVLALAALGYPNARIAASLGIGLQTAKGYLKCAMRKLGATSRLEAVTIARRSGVLP